MPSRVMLRPLGYAAAASVVALMVFNVIRYNPAKMERYTTPTAASFVIQKTVPFLYRPPIGIFTDRYGDGANGYNGPLHLVLGPDCRRYSVKDVSKLTTPAAVGARFCRQRIDTAKLAAIAKSKKTDHMDQWTYGELTREELESIL